MSLKTSRRCGLFRQISSDAPGPGLYERDSTVAGDGEFGSIRASDVSALGITVDPSADEYARSALRSKCEFASKSGYIAGHGRNHGSAVNPKEMRAFPLYENVSRIE
ncbi:hypothetical protein EAI_01456 [Harpegnathos saltator]|uniref:Uncharacterized protein n=1 Tax=Harpegnathos saltator TaxID=610380 RepID=E2BMG9_HARSA|nr:hypothetical protein EAI_01456 [Harpegnathos saltator]